MQIIKAIYSIFFLNKAHRCFQQLRDLLKENQIIALEYKSVKNPLISKAREEWRKWSISNFHFIIFLNIAGNRSFNDISQYPIIPWIISEFTKKINSHFPIQNSEIYHYQWECLNMNQNQNHQKERIF